MIKTGRITFTIGGIAFIMIGLLHSYVHLSELSGDALRIRYEGIGPIDLQGKTVSPWELFQGISLLMGFFSIAIGTVLLSTVLTCPKATVPHPSICIATMLLLLSIAVVGALYLSILQVIGGFFGLICFGTTLIARLRNQPFG